VKFFGSIIVLVRETVVCNQAGSVAGPTRATAYPCQVYMSSCNRAGAGEGEWETRARPGPAQGSRSHIQCESKLVSYIPKLRFGGKTVKRLRVQGFISFGSQSGAATAGVFSELLMPPGPTSRLFLRTFFIKNNFNISFFFGFFFSLKPVRRISAV
jgi:hypothetical protein